jgi:hypothetical protein
MSNVDIVEMRWACKACSRENLGRDMKCVACGKKRADEPYTMPEDTSHAAAVTDPALVKMAKAGANVPCSFCGCEERAGERTCKECGADLGSAIHSMSKTTKNVRETVLRKPGGTIGTSTRVDSACVSCGKKDVRVRVIAGGTPVPICGSCGTVQRVPSPKGQEPAVHDALRTVLGAAALRREDERKKEDVRLFGKPTSFTDLDFEDDAHAVGSGYRDAPMRDEPLKPRAGFFQRHNVAERLVRGGAEHGRAILIALGIAGMVLALYLILRPRIVDAEVRGGHWTAAVSVDRYAIHHHEEFDVPNGAFDVENLGPRIHHYDKVLDHYDHVSYTDREVCGQDCRTVSVPRTCYTTPRNCSSNKNGFATCTGGNEVCSGGGSRQECSTRYCNVTKYRDDPVYRDEPRYRDFHRFKRWEWAHNRDVVSQGLLAQPFTWPTDREVALRRDIAAGEDERMLKASSFEVTFGFKNDSWTYKPSSQGEFESFHTGDVRRIRVGPLGGVEIIR